MSRPPHVRQLAAELELLSFGGVANWNPSGRDAPDSRAPSGEIKPPHELFLADWDRKGESAVKFWRGELKRWRGHGQVKPEGMSEREIVLDAGRGYAADDVARRFRCTPTIVRKWRREAGVNEETGEGETQSARVKRLRDEGLTFRQIAALTGQSKSAAERAHKAA